MQTPATESKALSLLEIERMILRRVAAGEALTETLSDLLQAIATLVGSHARCGLFFLDADGDRLTRAATNDLPGAIATLERDDVYASAAPARLACAAAGRGQS